MIDLDFQSMSKPEPEPDPNGASVHVNQLSFVRFNGTQKLKRRTIDMYCSFIERINSELAKISLPDGLHQPRSGRLYWERYGQPKTITLILTIIGQIYTIKSNKDMQMRMSPLISMLNMVSESALRPWLAIKEQLHAGPVTEPVGCSRLYPDPEYTLHTVTDHWQVTQRLTDDEHLQFLIGLDPSMWIKTEPNSELLEQYPNAYYFIRHKDKLLSYVVEKLTL